MTLEEAIKQHQEKLEDLRLKIKDWNKVIYWEAYYVDRPEYQELLKCEKEYQQLIEWLTELKKWRELY